MFYLYRNKSVNKFPYSTHLRKNYLYSENVNKNPVKLFLLLLNYVLQLYQTDEHKLL